MIFNPFEHYFSYIKTVEGDNERPFAMELPLWLERFSPTGLELMITRSAGKVLIC